MKIFLQVLVVIGGFGVLTACAPEDGIDQTGAVFDGISDDATITLGGTEPFWSIQLRPQSGKSYSGRLSSPENADGSPFVATRFAGNNGLGFSGVLDGQAVQIAITPGDCSDGMSDRVYPFAATVSIGETTVLGCGHTSDNSFTGPQIP